MNLPENVSPAASRLYELIAARPSGQSLAQLSEAFNAQPTAEGSPKAIATANSLLAKGMINKAGEADATVYTLTKSPEGNTDNDSSEEGYTEGEGSLATDTANAEEQRMIDLLEQNDKKLPESKLFELYEKEQQPEGTTDATDGKNGIETTLKELTDAGAVTQDGDSYSIKK